MIPYRKLSIALTDLLAEAQALVDLKAKFGRLPNSAVKTAALEEIDRWFDTSVEDTTDDTVKTKLNLPYIDSKDAGEYQQGVGFLSFTDESAMTDNVPDDDDIPF